MRSFYINIIDYNAAFSRAVQGQSDIGNRHTTFFRISRRGTRGSVYLYGLRSRHWGHVPATHVDSKLTSLELRCAIHYMYAEMDLNLFLPYGKFERKVTVVTGLRVCSVRVSFSESSVACASCIHTQ